MVTKCKRSTRISGKKDYHTVRHYCYEQARSCWCWWGAGPLPSPSSPCRPGAVSPPAAWAGGWGRGWAASWRAACRAATSTLPSLSLSPQSVASPGGRFAEINSSFFFIAIQVPHYLAGQYLGAFTAASLVFLVYWDALVWYEHQQGEYRSPNSKLL